MPEPKQKIALVTGASRGIGRASAKALAAAGARVIVHYSSSAPEAEAVRREIDAAGGSALTLGGISRRPMVRTSLLSERGTSSVVLSIFSSPTPAYRSQPKSTS